MGNKYKLSALLILLLTMISCSSGHKAMKRGDYFKAVIDAVETLSKRPSSNKGQYVLSNAYPLALKASQRGIENALELNSQNNYESVVYEYERMNRIAEAIYSCPKANEIIPNPQSYYSELTDAKERAAEQLYNLAEKASDVGTIEQSKAAMNLYRKANTYVYGYRDVLNKIEDAKYESTLRVMVEKPKTSAKYQLTADFFSENLMSDVMQYFDNKLIRFYNANEENNINIIRPHQYLVLAFEDFSIGNTRDSQNTITVKRDSVNIGTATVRGEKVDVYNTVSAKYTTYRREIVSGGILSVRIYDKANRLIQQRRFSGEYVWHTEWANYSGDERALSQSQRSLLKQDPLMPPTQQQLFVEFTKPIYTQTLAYIKSYYGKY